MSNKIWEDVLEVVSLYREGDNMPVIEVGDNKMYLLETEVMGLISALKSFLPKDRKQAFREAFGEAFATDVGSVISEFRDEVWYRNVQEIIKHKFGDSVARLIISMLHNIDKLNIHE